MQSLLIRKRLFIAERLNYLKCVIFSTPYDTTCTLTEGMESATWMVLRSTEEHPFVPNALTPVTHHYVGDVCGRVLIKIERQPLGLLLVKSGGEIHLLQLIRNMLMLKSMISKSSRTKKRVGGWAHYHQSTLSKVHALPPVPGRYSNRPTAMLLDVGPWRAIFLSGETTIRSTINPRTCFNVPLRMNAMGHLLNGYYLHRIFATRLCHPHDKHILRW